MRVLEEMVWFIDWTKQEAAKGGGGAQGYEGGPTHRDLSPQLWATPGINPINVSTVWARDHHRRWQGPHQGHHRLLHSRGIVS